MRVGIFFWPYTPEYTIRMARLADELGFDLVGIADTPGNAMDPWVAMTLAAAHTTRARVAMCVTNVVTREPAVTAAAAASVDLVSGGRAVLGVGAGHSGVLNVGSPVAETAALGEALPFVRALLRGEAATRRGKTVRLPWVRRPVPVYLAASGPRALALAGRAADGAFVNYGLQAELVARAEALIRAGAAEAERRADEVEVWQIACLDCDARRETALDKLGSILAFVAAYVVGPDPAGRGVPADLVPAVRELRATYSRERGSMDPGLVKRLGLFDYLRGRLAVAGTPDDCVEQVREAGKAGVTRLMFSVSLAADPVRTVELFGRQVLPHVAA